MDTSTDSKHEGLEATNVVSTHEADVLQLPPGKKYRSFAGLPWYASPKTQLVMVSFVCFLCPGMFNALGGMGGGGKADATLADNMVCSPLFTNSYSC